MATLCTVDSFWMFCMVLEFTICERLAMCAGGSV